MVRTVRVVAVAVVLGLASAAVAGMHWSEITPQDCVAGTGKREWSAILWDIPSGQSWETACASTPASVNGAPSRGPDRCVVGTHVWGVWNMLDNNCGEAPPATYEVVVYPPRRGTLAYAQVIVTRNRNWDGRTYDIVARESLTNVLSGTPAAYRWRREFAQETADGQVIVRIWVRRPNGTEAGAGQAVHELRGTDLARTFEFNIRELNDGRYEVVPSFRIDGP